MKVLLSRGGPWHATLSERLKRIAGIAPVQLAQRDELVALLPGAAALVLSGREYDACVAAAVRAHGRDLRLLQFLTAGYEGAVMHGVRTGVAVCNAGDVYSPTVAEHAVTLLLAMVRQMPRVLEQQSRRAWDRAVSGELGSLDGMTVAVLGAGGIGRETGKRLRAFGCRVLAVTRRPRPLPEADEVHGLAELHEVLGRADAIVVALPLMPETEHLIGTAALAACRPGARLVNVARGGLVDQVALLDALDRGRLGGAALDVTTPEPLPADSPLWAHPRVIVSPHLGGVGTAAAGERLADLACGNIARLRAGQALLHEVRVGNEAR
jgi:phosphoglycerate dehydrogenase-like enzyme